MWEAVSGYWPLVVAFALVAVAVWIVVRDRRSRRLLPPLEYRHASRVVDVGGVRVHALQAGAGPHVVLLHGIGASAFIWRFVIDRLAERFTVTALDLPGFGRSSKEPTLDYGLDAQASRVSQALTALGISHATLVGSSMGGAIALWLARSEPERFARVVAMAPATSPRLVPRGVRRLAFLAPAAHVTLSPAVMRAILRRVFARRELIDPAVVGAYLEPYGEPASIRTFLAATALLADPRLPDALGTIRSQVLVLWGARDRLVPRRAIDELARHLPHSVLHVHPDAGHHPMEDEPEWCLSELEAFLGA